MNWGGFPDVGWFDRTVRVDPVGELLMLARRRTLAIACPEPSKAWDEPRPEKHPRPYLPKTRSFGQNPPLSILGGIVAAGWGSDRVNETPGRTVGRARLGSFVACLVFRQGSTTVNILLAIAQRGLAVLFLALSAPLFIGVALFLLFAAGRPLFYAGERLGLGKRRFRILKFRTLRKNAQQELGARLVDQRDRLTVRGGQFLRDTRLDELPQLINIIRGDMSFFGPRPERPEIYEQLCREIPGYDRRFHTRPGLIGTSQLFTPHRTPKRIRTRIDNQMLSRRPSAWAQLGMVFWTMVFVVKKVLAHGWKWSKERWRTWVGRMPANRRSSTRRPLRDVVLVSHEEEDPGICVAPVLDIDDECFRIHRPGGWAVGSAVRMVLRFPVGFGRDRPKLRTASAHAVVEQVRNDRSGPSAVLRYTPSSDYSQYLIARYLLGEQIRTNLPRRAPTRLRWRRRAVALGGAS